MTTSRAALALFVPFVLAACSVAPPAGPSVLALPAKGKDLQTFQAEDFNCRNYAQAQIGNTPANAANQAAVGSAAIGTGLGAAAGALLGSVGGAMGAGAAIGAGAGLLAGSAVGAGNAQASAGSLQERYDNAYVQCIASTGNSVQAPPLVTAVPVAPAYAYPAYGYGYPAYGYPGYGYGYGYPYYGPGNYWGPSVSFGYRGGWGGWRRRW